MAGGRSHPETVGRSESAFHVEGAPQRDSRCAFYFRSQSRLGHCLQMLRNCLTLTSMIRGTQAQVSPRPAVPADHSAKISLCFLVTTRPERGAAYHLNCSMFRRRRPALSLRTEVRLQQMKPHSPTQTRRCNRIVLAEHTSGKTQQKTANKMSYLEQMITLSRLNQLNNTQRFLPIDKMRCLG